MILLLLIVKLEFSEDKSFAGFDGTKWMKEIIITECGNEKPLTSLTNFFRDIGELCANANIEVVSLELVYFLIHC